MADREPLLDDIKNRLEVILSGDETGQLGLSIDMMTFDAAAATILPENDKGNDASRHIGLAMGYVNTIKSELDSYKKSDMENAFDLLGECLKELQAAATIIQELIAPKCRDYSIGQMSTYLDIGNPKELENLNEKLVRIFRMLVIMYGTVEKCRGIIVPIFDRITSQIRGGVCVKSVKPSHMINYTVVSSISSIIGQKIQ